MSILEKYFCETTLPNPLSDEELKCYLLLAQSGDLSARNKIIVHNIRFVINYVLKNYHNTSYEVSDLISVGIIGLIYAISCFDITKEYDFVSYSCKCIKNEILKYFNKNNKHLNVISLETPINAGSSDKKICLIDTINEQSLVDIFEGIENKEVINLLIKEIENLNNEYKAIIKFRIGLVDGVVHSYKEIGEILGIDRRRVSMSYFKAIELLKQRLNMEGGYYKKIRKKSKMTTEKISIFF